MRLLFAPSSAIILPWLFKPRISGGSRHWRSFSKATTSALHEDTVRVPIGNNGHITLRILKPAEQSDTSNVIFYLPPGPIFEAPRQKHDASSANHENGRLEPRPVPIRSPQEILATTTGSTVVTVKYRLGRERVGGRQKTHKYPVPVHDTLAGFDWVQENIKYDNFFVYGQHIGGSLALMLALTESRSITAVATEHPVCDWVGLDDYCITDIDNPTEKEETEPEANKELNEASNEPEGDDELHARKRGRKKKGPTPAPADLVPLLEARKKIFRTPQNYFDPFASPALFLRTPGKYCPLTFPTYHTGPDYPIPELKRHVKTEADELYMTDILASINQPSPTEGAEIEQIKKEAKNWVIKPVQRRKVLRRWPPRGLDYGLDPYTPSFGESRKFQEVTLPPVRIYVGSSTPDAQPGELPGGSNEDDISARMNALGIEDPEHEQSTNNDKKQDQDHRQRPPRVPRGSIGSVARSEGDSVLAHQSKEMVTLMHNACFWGRDKEAEQQKVDLVRIPLPSSSPTVVSSSTETSGSQKDLNSRETNHSCIQDDSITRVEVQAGQYFMSILKT
ncbi:hypothetical protein FQN57_001384 [Myotisia sp. PD_48]|nr:hypothetical protein FQN57_001384 [Myotisia sp. PD_48]